MQIAARGILKDPQIENRDHGQHMIEDVGLNGLVGDPIDRTREKIQLHRETRLGGLQLTDWEYAGMQDPHVDIAMFCVYSLYGRKEIDNLIDIYFAGVCSNIIRIKIYCYIAVCGLLWSNWCEYKQRLGGEFGEYSLRQYRYAKDYYKIVMEELSHES